MQKYSKIFNESQNVAEIISDLLQPDPLEKKHETFKFNKKFYIYEKGLKIFSLHITIRLT